MPLFTLKQLEIKTLELAFEKLVQSSINIKKYYKFLYNVTFSVEFCNCFDWRLLVKTNLLFLLILGSMSKHTLFNIAVLSNIYIV